MTINLPHQQAALTDLVGGHRQPLAGGPAYHVPRPPAADRHPAAEDHAAAVAAVKPLLDWEPLVPPQKRAALHQYLKTAVGHPPRGS